MKKTNLRFSVANQSKDKHPNKSSEQDKSRESKISEDLQSKDKKRFGVTGQNKETREKETQTNELSLFFSKKNNMPVDRGRSKKSVK